MLLAVVVSGKLLTGAVLAAVALVALVIYLPGAIVREVTQAEDAPLPAGMGTVRARRARLRVILGVLGCLAIGAAVWGWASYEPAKTALVVVDNNSDEPLTLRSGGPYVLVVAPHSRARWDCAPGRNRITLVGGQAPVFDQEVDLADGGKYIVNPDATSHYAIWAQEYSTDFRLPNRLAKPRFSELQEQARRIKLIEPAKWHEVTADYILAPPPALIKSSSRSGSGSRTIVSSLSRGSFDVLRESRTKRPDEPVDEEFVERLNNVLSSITVSMPGFGDGHDT